MLGGTLSALGGIGPEDLAVQPLLGRIETGAEPVREVILALPATVDGQTLTRRPLESKAIEPQSEGVVAPDEACRLLPSGPERW